MDSAEDIKSLRKTLNDKQLEYLKVTNPNLRYKLKMEIKDCENRIELLAAKKLAEDDVKNQTVLF